MAHDMDAFIEDMNKLLMQRSDTNNDTEETDAALVGRIRAFCATRGIPTACAARSLARSLKLV